MDNKLNWKQTLEGVNSWQVPREMDTKNMKNILGTLIHLLKLLKLDIRGKKIVLDSTSPKTFLYQDISS